LRIRASSNINSTCLYKQVVGMWHSTFLLRMGTSGLSKRFLPNLLPQKRIQFYDDLHLHRRGKYRPTTSAYLCKQSTYNSVHDQPMKRAEMCRYHRNGRNPEHVFQSSTSNFTYHGGLDICHGYRLTERNKYSWM